ncbi:complex I NDUFA9 subunit family protein [Thermithiobacillus plumbiphilus]|uniref:Complex I NDUFA9 subunit family protein n=1 Tax=Thermithiobacillus plumbiphilus TaxID=1729899 RepID=A0ABU9D964_9PROT
MTIRKVCILGGSGFVGRHIAERLDAKGIRVRILTRNRENHRELLVMPNVELVEGNPLDPMTLTKQLEGMDAVINLVGILNERKRGRNDLPPERRGDFHQIHEELPRLVVNTCGKVGVSRVLHMSALGADPTAPSAYLRSKGIGQEIVRQAGEDSAAKGWFTYLDGPKLVWGQGLQVTIFRPSIIFGHGDSFFTRFARLLRRIPMFLPLAKPHARLQPVWVEDVAEAFVRALDNSRTHGQIYDLCGPRSYTLRELVEYTRSVIGSHKAIINLPDWLAYVQANVLERLPGKLMTRDNLHSLSVDNVCEADCFPAFFGIQPEAIETVVPGYLGKGRSRTERLSRIRLGRESR